MTEEGESNVEENAEKNTEDDVHVPASGLEQEPDIDEGNDGRVDGDTEGRLVQHLTGRYVRRQTESWRRGGRPEEEPTEKENQGVPEGLEEPKKKFSPC